jgi:Tol biopolymer transport system component
MRFYRIIYKSLFLIVIFPLFSCEKESIDSVIFRDFEGKFVYNDYKQSSYDIYVLDSKGARQITSSGINQISPQWLPDGKHLMYLSDDVEGLNIHVMDDQGSNDRNVIEAGNSTISSLFYPHIYVAPDGKFVVLDRRDSIIIFEISHDYNLTKISAYGCSTEYKYLSWAPDSKKFSCACPGIDSLRHLNVYDVETRQIIDLTVDFGQHIRNQTWSYNSSIIAFISHFDIYIINSDGTGLKKIVSTDNFFEAALAFSPIDDRIVYERADSLYDLVLYDLNTQTTEILLDDHNSISSPLIWIEDGKYILYGFGEETFDRDGFKLYEVETKESHTIINESVKGISWIQD